MYDEGATTLAFSWHAPGGGGGRSLIQTLTGTGGKDRFDGNWVDANGNIMTDYGNIIYGGLGNDRVYDFAGNDTVFGGGGNDLFFGGHGADAYDGGEGRDEVRYYIGQIEGLTVNMLDVSQNTGRATGDTYTSIERIWGSDYDDVLIVGNADLSQADAYGRAGNDVPMDSAGTEWLRGDGGSDVFIFVAGDGVEDRVIDFNPLEDKLDVSSWGVTSVSDLVITAATNNNYVTVLHGAERLRLNNLESADVAVMTDDVFVW